MEKDFDEIEKKYYSAVAKLIVIEQSVSILYGCKSLLGTKWFNLVSKVEKARFLELEAINSKMKDANVVNKLFDYVQKLETETKNVMAELGGQSDNEVQHDKQV